MDLKKQIDGIDEAVAGCNEPETLKKLNELKLSLIEAEKEVGKISSENEELNKANKQLTEAVKANIIQSGGNKKISEDNGGGSPQPKTLEQCLKEAYENHQKKG